MPAHHERGFTLIELLVVVMIIGILAGIGFSQYGKVIESTKAEEALVITQSISNARRAYRLDNTQDATNALKGEMTNCDPAAATGSSVTDPCNLMYDKYMARQSLANRGYQFFAGVCEGAASIEVSACSKRKADAPPAFRQWGYLVSRYGEVTQVGPADNLPPAPK